MKIVFKIKEDDARNPGVIADCVGDNAGDSVGPTADGFETYGVTGVALITFILLAVPDPDVQVQCLSGSFVIAAAYGDNKRAVVLHKARDWPRGRYATVRHMNFEAPLTALVWIASITSILGTYLASYLLIGHLVVHGVVNGALWWKLADDHHLRDACRRDHSRGNQDIHLDPTSRHCPRSRHRRREGGASLNVLSGLAAGDFSAYWVGGVTIGGLMALA